MIITANGQNIEIEEGRRFTCLVHQQGIRVNVPEAVEINSRNTIDCMEKMSQRAWTHISTGPLFQELFYTLFPKEDGDITLPETIEQLNQQDFGVVHGCGMIVLGCEAIFEGKTKIFFRNPENHLHPKTERRVVEMFYKMIGLSGGGGTVVAEEKPGEKS